MKVPHLTAIACLAYRLARQGLAYASVRFVNPLQIEESRMRVLLRLLLLGLVVTAIGQARALAEPAPTANADKVRVAKQYVDAGLAAQGSGDYDTAITLYSKAYQLVPHPLLIFNMAQAHRLAGHVEQALSLYAQYLAEDPHGAQAQTAHELVAELEARKPKQARGPEEARKDGAARKAGAGRKTKVKATDAGAEGDPEGGDAERVARPGDEEPDDRTDDRQTGGTLVVNAKGPGGAAIDDGTVMVDEEPRGKLAGGKLKVKRIAEGRHTVAIEAGGYRRFEETVTVQDGEQASLDAVLREKAAPSSISLRTIEQVALGASVTLAVAGTTYGFYSYSRQNQWLDRDSLLLVRGTGDSVTSKDCGMPYEQVLRDEGATSFSAGAFDRACTWNTRIYIGEVLAGVGVLGAVASLILLSRDPEPPETKGRRTKPAVAIVPIVTPDGGGASFSLTW
jgi:hypothetical protein